MPRLSRLLHPVLLILILAYVLLGVTRQMADAGLGCPWGWDCLAGAAQQRLELTTWIRPLTVAGQWLLGLMGGLLLIAALRPLGRDRSGAWALWAALAVVGFSIWFETVGTDPRTQPWLIALSRWAPWLLWVLVPLGSSDTKGPAAARGFRGLVRTAVALLLVSAFLGIWVSLTGAGLVCPDFPTCQGQWWPLDGLDTLIQNLGPKGWAPGVLLRPEVQSVLLMLHRFVGLAGLILVGGLAMILTGQRDQPQLSRLGLWLQIGVFLSVLVALPLAPLQLPIALGVLHAALSLFLLTGLLRIRLGASKSVPKPEISEGARVPVPMPPAPTKPLRLGDRVGRTRGGLIGFLKGRRTLARTDLEDLEAQLLMADLGVGVTAAVLASLEQQMARDGLTEAADVKAALRQQLATLVAPVSQPLVIPRSDHPFVILVVGVNGVGKTTTIGKLARRFQQQGLKVLLAAGDTFRAAAVEQLETWGARHQIPVIAQKTGADAASVIFDALEAARARHVDVLIADTAGRLHNKSNLMEELAKIKRIMARLDPTAPHEVLLVLDAGTGQNALNQAREFHQAVGLTGLALTKLDGTAKGGVLFALAQALGIPIRFIGVGEGAEDLRDFDADEFIAALFDEPEGTP